MLSGSTPLSGQGHGPIRALSRDDSSKSKFVTHPEYIPGTLELWRLGDGGNTPWAQAVGKLPRLAVGPVNHRSNRLRLAPSAMVRAAARPSRRFAFQLNSGSLTFTRRCLLALRSAMVAKASSLALVHWRQGGQVCLLASHQGIAGSVLYRGR